MRAPRSLVLAVWLATIAARRGDEETQLKHLRDGVAVAHRVYPKGHGYRKEAQTNLIRALNAQAEKYEKLGDAASVEKAKARRQELESVSKLE